MVGKASTPKAPPGVYRDDPDRDDAASTSSAVPLQENTFDDNEDDLPPYIEEPSAITPSRRNGPPLPEDDDPKIEQWTSWPTVAVWTPFKRSVHRGSRYTRLSPTFTSDPVALCAYLNYRVLLAPRAFVCVHGEHTETRYDGKDKKQETKVDFSVRFDVTETISAPRSDEYVPWASVVAAEPYQKMYRGTRIKKRHPKFKADVEDGPLKQSLLEWCHLFTASRSALKSFTIHQRVLGRDDALLQRRIESVIRGTNYRGRLNVRFELDPYTVTITTPHWLNRLRHNSFLYWFCILTQLWILTWPVLFLLTKRWEVVDVEWPFRKPKGEPRQIVTEEGQRRVVQDYTYGSESEEAWVKKWKSTIEDGIMSGQIQDQIVQFVPNDPEGRAARDEAARRARAAEPTEGFAGGAMGLLRGIGNMVREDRDARGWGYDT